jgi:hypothetical protein
MLSKKVQIFMNLTLTDSQLLSSFNHGISGKAFRYAKNMTYIGLGTAWCAAVVGFANSHFQEPNTILKKISDTGMRSGMVVTGRVGTGMALVVMAIFIKIIIHIATDKR